MKTLSSRILLLVALGLLVPFASSPASAAGSGGSSTRDAERLIAEIRTELRPIENQIRNHPYITALERGQVSRDNLRAFAGAPSSAPPACCRPMKRASGTPWRRIEAG
jgi:hypothetical protein